MLGNDVVDLREADGPRHPRFDARVFAPAERRRIAADPRLRWAFWAAKEAAFKRARRDDPGVVFSPGRFVVELGPELRGRVRHGSRSWAVRVEAGEAYVHAVAADTPAAAASARARVAVRRPGEDPSGAVRRRALRDLARALGLRAEALRIERRGRVPWLRVRAEAGATPLSLSHHGRFVAWACPAPAPGGVR